MNIRCHGGLFDGREIPSSDIYPRREIEFVVSENLRQVGSGAAPTAHVAYVRVRYVLARTAYDRWVYVPENFYAAREEHDESHQGQSPVPDRAG